MMMMMMIFMTAIFAVTFVMSAVLICKWTLSHYDDDDDDDDDTHSLTDCAYIRH